MQVVAGIDPSISATAIVVGDLDGYESTVISTKHRAVGRSSSDRVKCYHDIVSQVVEYLGKFDSPKLFIEGYSYGSFASGSTVACISELGGILRFYLVDIDPDMMEVPPSSLKKFCAGSGNADKSIVAAHITRTWGAMFPTNDQFDAFGCWRLGLAASGECEATNEPQRSVLKKLLGG